MRELITYTDEEREKLYNDFIMVWQNTPEFVRHKFVKELNCVLCKTCFDEVSMNPSVLGSTYFNSATQGLSTPYAANHQLGTNDFTIEFWYYPSYVSGVGGAGLGVIFGNMNSGYGAPVPGEFSVEYYYPSF